MRSKPVEAKAASRFRTDILFGWAVLPILAVALFAGAARAQSDDLIVTHALSTFGVPKYGPDFEHLDYVNPDAPQGGEMSFAWSSGSFDSMHP